jgi:hypothetical protein
MCPTEKAWKPEYRSAPIRARANDEAKSHADKSSGPAETSLPHQQAVDMTALETFTTVSKQPSTTGRRPEMAAIRPSASVLRRPSSQGSILSRPPVLAHGDYSRTGGDLHPAGGTRLRSPVQHFHITVKTRAKMGSRSTLCAKFTTAAQSEAPHQPARQQSRRSGVCIASRCLSLFRVSR